MCAIGQKPISVPLCVMMRAEAYLKNEQHLRDGGRHSSTRPGEGVLQLHAQHDGVPEVKQRQLADRRLLALHTRTTGSQRERPRLSGQDGRDPSRVRRIQLRFREQERNDCCCDHFISSRLEYRWLEMQRGRPSETTQERKRTRSPQSGTWTGWKMACSMERTSQKKKSQVSARESSNF